MEGDPIVGSSSSSAIKKRKKRSAVWDQMRKYKDANGNDTAECKHCKKTFDGQSTKGTTHLKNHLERCPANPKRKGRDGRDGDDRDQSLSPSIKTKELASLIKEKSVRGLIEHLSNMDGDEDWNPSSVLNSRKDEILQLYQEEKEKLRQFLNNLSCRFSLQLVRGCVDFHFGFFLAVYYIDDNWERQSKIISFLPDHNDVEDSIKAVKQSCLDWKIDGNICSLHVLFSSSLDLVIENEPAEDWDNQIGNMESWFSQRRRFSQRGYLPFAGCLRHADGLMYYIDDILLSEDYFGDEIRSLKECARYVQNKSTSDELIQLDSAVKIAIYTLTRGPPFSDFFDYIGAAVGLKEVCLVLEQFDCEFRSINLSKQKWDEVTAMFEHLKFLNDVAVGWKSGKCGIPIIVDLPYVHKILKDRCNHPIEDCLFCKKVMKKAIDQFFSKYYSVGVIAVILDPRFKMDGVQLHYKEIYGSDADRYLEKVNKDFRDFYDAYAATHSSNSKSYEMLDATGRPSSPKSELDLYMKELKVPAVQEFDILAWWRGNAPFYPTLARMARDYLATEDPFAPKEDAFFALRDDIDYISHNFRFRESTEIIIPLLWLKVFLSRLKISGYL